MKKARIVLLSAIIFLLSASVLLPQQHALAAAYMQAKTDANLKGVDVSHWNGTIDWRQVKSSGIAFAYMKATEGKTFIDPNFAGYISSARAAALPVGAYHYARPTAPYNPDEAKAQAQFFVSVMQQNGLSDYGDIMPVLDLEQPAAAGSLSSTEIAQWARVFVDTAKSLTNRQIMIYTGVWFVQQYDDFGGALADLPVWIADYTRFGDPQPPVVGGWTQWTVWQHSDQSIVPGISGYVDLNAGPTSIGTLKGDLTRPTSPPSAPAGFAASAVSASSVSLTWNTVQGAESYTLRRDGAIVYKGNASGYTDAGLSANRSYTYTLTADNAHGSSNPVTLTVTTAQSNLLVTTVSTNSSTYYSRSSAKITTTVKDGSGQAVKGATVIVTVKSPSGQLTKATGTSDSYGNFVYSFYIPKKASGTYTITSQTSLTGYPSGSAGATFYVKK